MVRYSSRRMWVALLCSLLVLFFTGKAFSEPRGKLIVFHAGSLTIPFAKIEKQFETKYPGVNVLCEGGGSTKMARMISELRKPADIMAAADYAVIDNFLIPRFATWNTRFATNQIVLCYTEKSKYAPEINSDNWYQILLRKGVIWGHSDPNLDPCGYRSLMVMQLAEKFYNKPGLYEKLLANRPKRNVLPKSVELISLLQTGNMDYAWEYLSVAVQHKLKYVKLDDHINLGNYKYDNFYKQAVVKVAGKKPGQWITKRGKSCTYGITMLTNAQNPEAALVFLEFLFDLNGGLRVLKEMGQPPFVPCRVPTREMYEKLPKELQKFVEIKD